MSIFVQSRVVRLAGWRKCATKNLLASLLTSTKNQGKSISLVLVGRNAMVHMNRKYRGKYKSTDVLSFPGHDEYVGEIYICPSVMIRITRGRNYLVNKLCRKLIIHGFAHLIGHDHETDSDYQIMRRVEASLWRASDKYRLIRLRRQQQ
jgi:rRNA maturation RNase YbeY